MQVKIGRQMVGLGAPCFVIAEIGINHNGSIKLALDLIREAAAAGANAVKFQKRDVAIVYSDKERMMPRAFDRSFIANAMERSTIEGVRRPVFPEQGQHERLEAFLRGEHEETTNGDLKYALEFGPKEWDMIRMACEEEGVAWGVSSWDGLSVFEIDGFQPDFHKVASACLPHADLLKRMRRCGRPVILSTGGSTLEQVHKAVDILGRNDLVVLQCVATYPSEDKEANVAAINTLRDEFHNVPIGYSGHEADWLATKLAVSLGACVVERHITLDRSLPGSDQKASITPAEFKEMVADIRAIETKRGTQLYLAASKWASADEMDRVGTLTGSGEKRVQEREAATMAKLRRVTDF